RGSGGLGDGGGLLRGLAARRRRAVRDRSAAGQRGRGARLPHPRPRFAAESAAVLAAIAAACKRRLWITNAYFAPGRRAVRILEETAARGVDVRLLLPGQTDVPVVRHAGHGYYGALLECGVRVFEYEAAILHSKCLVADGLVSVVGSTNLDFRSFLFNAECDLVILCPATAATLERAFREDLEKSEEIRLDDWRRRPLAEKLGDRAARWLSPVL